MQSSDNNYPRQERREIITDDMTSITRSCCTEMATDSAPLLSPERRVVDLRPPKCTAPKRRREPPHRRRRRYEKRACSQSSQLLLKGSALGRTKGYHPISSHMSRSPISATFTSSSLTTTAILSPAPPSDNPTTPHAARRNTSKFPFIFPSRTATDSITHAWSGNQRHGGYVGFRFGEAANSGLATHEQDWTEEQPDSTLRRINDAGDSVPSSQNFMTDSPAASMASPVRTLCLCLVLVTIFLSVSTFSPSFL